jgi:hypothetical protein
MQVMFGVLGNEILHKGDCSQSHFATRQSIIPPLDVPFHDLQSDRRLSHPCLRAFHSIPTVIPLSCAGHG